MNSAASDFSQRFTRMNPDKKQSGKRKTESGPSAIARAEALYRQHYPGRLFVERLGTFLRIGYVVNFPDLFAMAKPIALAAGTVATTEDRIFESPDAWYVDLAVGSEPDGRSALPRLVQLLPYRLPFICFYRKFQNKLKVYPMDKFLTKATTLC